MRIVALRLKLGLLDQTRTFDLFLKSGPIKRALRQGLGHTFDWAVMNREPLPNRTAGNGFRLFAVAIVPVAIRKAVTNAIV